jgi:hypothetical protein
LFTKGASRFFRTPEQSQDLVARVTELERNVVQASSLPAERKAILLGDTRIQSWIVAAPLSDEVAKTAITKIVESQEQPKANESLGSLKWKPVMIYGLEPLDLRARFSRSAKNVSAVAVARFVSAKPQTVTFYLGSDDGATVWVNGQQKFSKSIDRSFLSRNDQFPVDLQRGENLIVVQVEQAGGEWKFAIEMDDETGWPVAVDWFEPESSSSKSGE